MFDVFRDRPPTFHVQAWYDEVRYYSYPYSQECNPHCPFRCSGPVCTHYTQVSGVCNSLWTTAGDHACLCPASCVSRSAGVGHQQSYRLCHQRVLQHERVGDDLDQGRVPGVQLLSAVRLPTAVQHRSEYTNSTFRHSGTAPVSDSWVKPFHCFCRGNWWGHAPYKYGAPCSACPDSYAGACRDNLCYKGTYTVGLVPQV